MSPGIPVLKVVRRHGATRFVPAVLIAVVLLLQATSSIAMIPPYQIEDLSGLSTDIVVGNVLDAHSDWQDWPYGGRVIMTTYTVQVTEVLKGKAPAEISVVTPGGRVGDTIIDASDSPVLPVGGQVTLFLKKDLKGFPRFWIFGLERGAFEVDRGVAQPLAAGASPITLVQLKARVARALENQR